MKSPEWALIPHDWCPSEKRRLGQTHAEGPPCGAAGRRAICLSTCQGERPQKPSSPTQPQHLPLRGRSSCGSRWGSPLFRQTHYPLFLNSSASLECVWISDQRDSSVHACHLPGPAGGPVSWQGQVWPPRSGSPKPLNGSNERPVQGWLPQGTPEEEVCLQENTTWPIVNTVPVAAG